MDAGGMALPLMTASGRRFIAHVLPLTSGARACRRRDYSAVAALFVREASIDVSAAINAAALLYGLTPAEEKVLRGVIEVGGVTEVASMLGTAKSTVKTHLEHVFKKTGTSRQAELVRLIAGFDSPARPARAKVNGALALSRFSRIALECVGIVSRNRPRQDTGEIHEKDLPWVSCGGVVSRLDACRFHSGCRRLAPRMSFSIAPIGVPIAGRSAACSGAITSPIGSSKSRPPADSRLCCGNSAIRVCRER